jgi:hypothetical protein
MSQCRIYPVLLIVGRYQRVEQKSSNKIPALEPVESSAAHYMTVVFIIGRCIGARAYFTERFFG